MADNNFKKPIVSIIVPCYNVGEYLADCLDSLIEQTFKDIEIVCVNDGSTDKTPQILDDYAKKDSRIKIVTQENGGLSSARNAGMENASGDYYIFVDSDDTISPNMVEEMVKKAKEHDAKIVSSLISEEQDKLGKGNTGKVTVLNTHDALKSIFSDGLVVTSSSGKMYAADLWEDIRFPTDMIFEDFATIYKVIIKAPKVVSFEDWQYFYRPNPAGITGTPFYHRKMQFFDVAAKVSEGISDTHPDLVPVIRNRVTRQAISYYRDISSSGYDDAEDRKFIVKTVRKGIWKYLFSRYKAKSKMFGLLIAVSPPLARKVFAK